MTGRVRFEISSRSEPGGHPHNEDAFATQVLAGDPESCLCVVADGQGGQHGGGAAARLACQVVLAEAVSLPPKRLLQTIAWDGILRSADRAVCIEPGAGFTTVVACCLSETFLCGASNGDSAAVLLQQGRRGVVLSDAQEKNPPIGCGEAALVPFACQMSRPWTLLVMSDGVWKFSRWERILSLDATRPGSEIVDSLYQAARLPRSGGLQDDFTLVAIQWC